MFVPNDSGAWVDENFIRCNEIIHDFDPKLDLRYIRAEYRKSKFDKPYALVDTETNQVCYTFHESVTPEEILEKLFMGDNRDGNMLERLDARNAAIKAIELKKQLEVQEEAREQAIFLTKTKKNFIKHKTRDGSIVKLDDQLRRIG